MPDQSSVNKQFVFEPLFYKYWQAASKQEPEKCKPPANIK